MKIGAGMIMGFIFFGLQLFGQAENSVLKEGRWYKLAVASTGVYRIDHEYLRNNGISILDAESISVFGQTGGPLPEKISSPRIDDLVEYPGYAIGNSRLYYLEGADVWRATDDVLNYAKNVYDIYNYVFINIGGSTPNEMGSAESPLEFGEVRSTYISLQRFEEDIVNPLGIFPTVHGSGQEWYGDQFLNLRSKDYSKHFDFSDMLADNNGECVNVKASFVGRSNVNSEVILNVDGQEVSRAIVRVRTGDIEAIHARKAVVGDCFSVGSESPNITIDYPQTSSESVGWLDFIETEIPKYIVHPITSYHLNEHFYETSISSGVRYAFNDRARNSTLVWDVTVPESPSNVIVNDNGWNAELEGQPKRYFVHNIESASYPEGEIVEVENQNLHGINDADLVVVYHSDWKTAAQRFADHRIAHSELNVEIVDVRQIFNEFSSGKQDPTAIRDFARMLKQRSENFRYLLLFGDGSYDFRGIDTNFDYQSFIPTYETLESLDPLEAFPSDDYFAQLDDDEGENLRGDLDIAVGRVPVRNLEEANQFVDKIISYDVNNNSLGAWRSRVSFLADDEDSNLHLNDADIIANDVKVKYPIFNQQKIYWDAFIQESTPGGNRYPDANRQLNRDIDQGMLVINYLGHGGPKGWSQERVLNLDDIASWNNFTKLPLIITATCSFTGFDDPSLTSAGEATILNPRGGAIALFTTVRSVYASQNFRLTAAVFDTIFSKVGGEYMTIGEIMQSAKNTRVNDVVNARKFFLIGDPSMRLAVPSEPISVERLRASSDFTGQDTISAGSMVDFEAVVLNPSGGINEEFNGIAEVVLFDKESDVKTLKNDASSFEKVFKLRKNELFKGAFSVKNGRIAGSFVVPLDIDYTFGNGRLSIYAQNDRNIDASGYSDHFIIGGTDLSADNDELGPEINVFVGSKSFRDNDEISSVNPLIFADFSDESGMNVSNVSIGHEIVGLIDDDTRTIEVLNELYTSALDDPTKGSLSYQLQNLTLGQHTLTIRAFDVFNNPSSKTVTFHVVEDLKDFLSGVVAFPNPFKTFLDFQIANELGGQVDALIRIYNSNGQLLHTIEKNSVSGEIISGRLDQGIESMTSGVYMYDVTLISTESGESVSSQMKNVVLLK